MTTRKDDRRTGKEGAGTAPRVQRVPALAGATAVSAVRAEGLTAHRAVAHADRRDADAPLRAFVPSCLRAFLVGHGGPTLHAFTLVELLVVITIIGILVSILVPAVGAVRKAARSAATSAALTTIGTGLETFKADAKLGGQYPPSFSDANPTVLNSTLLAGYVYSPYGNPPNPVSFPISGAGLLLWALSGADLLGTPGFQSYGTPELWSEWSSNTLNTGDESRSGAYALDANTQPVHPRSGRYVDISKLRVTRMEGGAPGTPHFAIPEEFKILGPPAPLGTAPQRPYPMYLDAFGYPILYWRADPAGRALADRVPDAGNNRGVYHYADNSWLLETSSAGRLVLNKGGMAHALRWGSDPGNYYDPSSGDPQLKTFEGYIWDKAVQAKKWPQRADSYLLVSPGADGLYGTGDDVTNFQHNGQ